MAQTILRQALKAGSVGLVTAGTGASLPAATIVAVTGLAIIGVGCCAYALYNGAKKVID